MSIKSKSRQRLIVLFAAAAVVLGGGAGAFVFHKYQVRQRLSHDRVEGLEAAKNKDYATAVKDLDDYLRVRPADVEVLKAYVQARPNVGAGSVEEAKDTLSRLRQLVLLDPSNVDARRQLMDLYWHYGYVAEAEEQAQAILLHDPKDADALMHLLFAKLRLRGDEMNGNKQKHIASAEEVAEQWAVADPSNPEPDFFILDLMVQSNHPGEEIIARAKKLAGPNQKTPQAELIIAEGYRLANDRATAASLLKQAAAQPMPSPQFTKVLANQLNTMGLYHESMQLLQRQSTNGSDPAIAEDLADRQWEMGKPEQVIALTNGIESKLSSEGKAIRAISLRAVGKKAEADAIQQELAADGTTVASAWAVILKQLAQPASVSPREVVDACENVVKSGGGGHAAYLQFFLSAAYEELGEKELAVDALTKAAQENPTWTVPLIRLSALELERQRPNLAMSAAMAAWNRSQQTSVGAAIAIAKAWTAISENNEAEGNAGAALVGPPSQLLGLVEQMHAKLPGEEQTLGMYISLLCQVNPPRTDQAKRELRNALDNNKNLSEEGLIHLAALSNKYKLGATDECFTLAQKKFGMSSNLAYAEAVRKWTDGAAPAGRDLLEKSRPKNLDDKEKLSWDVADARYLELTQDPRAAASWKALADANPDNLFIQQTILKTRSVSGDRDLLARTIERLRKLTGEDALTWRLAQARLTLSGHPSQQDLADTSLQLKQIINQAADLAEPYALLGECYDRLGNLTEALTALQTAVQKDSTNVSLALYYTRLLQRHGDFDKASTVLSSLPQSNMTATQRREAAELLAQGGQTEQAATLMAGAGASDVQSELMLAALDRHQGEIAAVYTLCDKILAHPNTGAIAFSADFYASQGKMDLAQRTLARLDSMKVNPAEAAVVRADFASHYQSPQQAVAYLKAGLANSPNQPDLWRAQVRIELGAGMGDAAKETLTQSHNALPDDPGLNLLQQNANLLAALSANPALRSSVVALVDDPRNDNPMLAALKQINSAIMTKQDSAQLAASLQAVLDQNPHSYPLRILVIQCYLDLHTPDAASHAAQLATEAMQIFPAETEPVKLAAQADLQAGRMSEALGYLKMWHDRSGGDTIGPDLLTAQAYYALNRPNDAVETAKPYLATMLAKPDLFANDLLVYGACLNATGDQDQAQKIFWPLAQTDSAWRQRWIAMAMRCKTAEEAAVWLNKVQPIIGNDPNDLLALSQSWHSLSVASGNAQYNKNARAIFEQLMARNDLSADMLETMAVTDEQAGNEPEAQSLYRRTLAVKPDSVISLNNLAMIEARSPDKLNDAAGLAQRAVAAAPKMATLYDTLAFVQAQQHNYTDASATMQHAIDQDPNNMLWRVHQAKYYWEGGKRREAQNAAAQISVMQPPDDASGKQSLKEWQALKTEMSKQASAQ